MNEINKKDRELIASMAASIAGPILAAALTEASTDKKGVSGDILEIMAQMAVSQSIEILDAIKLRIRCGECENCKQPIPRSERCSKIPGKEI